MIIIIKVVIIIIIIIDWSFFVLLYVDAIKTYASTGYQKESKLWSTQHTHKKKNSTGTLNGTSV